jgi:putative tricarboxylic transport membrane protein
LDILNNISLGFSVCLQPINVFYCFVGVFIGTLIGVLPGIGPVSAMALLLPSTYHVQPVTSIIMMAGIYYGAMYGGSTTSILVNIPGEAASVITCLDGYQMARQGRAGAALGISAFGSFIAGTVSVIALMCIAPPLAEMALKFGPPEYVALMCLGLTILIFLSRGSMIKAFLMAALGLFLGTIGFDIITGDLRFVYGRKILMDGIGLIQVAIGLFGLTEIFLNIEETVKREFLETRMSHLLPSLKDWKESIGPIIRGSIVGFFVGIIPGPSGVISTFTAYAVEKKISKHPEKFGTGVIAGVAAPESANNAATGGAFIPLLTLGIPSNAVMALMLGALMIQGVQPGPSLIAKNPQLFRGVVASMYVGNIMLLVLNIPLIGLWVKILKVPYSILFPMILLFCIIGTYTLNNNIYDVLIMVFFGVLGYAMKKYDYESPPLILALVLGPIMENSLRQSLIISNGSFQIFLTRPISGALLLIALALLLIALALLLSSLLPMIWKRRQQLAEKIKTEGS